MTLRVGVFDIDGTLANCDARLIHLAGPKKNWDAFHAGMANDVPYLPVVDLAKIVQKSLVLVCCTGRPVSTYNATMTWLEAQGLDIHALFMRQDGDYRKAPLVKREMLRDMNACGFEVTFVVEDQDDLVKMWRDEGLTCFQCREWKPVETPQPRINTDALAQLSL